MPIFHNPILYHIFNIGTYSDPYTSIGAILIIYYNFFSMKQTICILVRQIGSGYNNELYQTKINTKLATDQLPSLKFLRLK